jgi:hypothetical protein
MNHCLSPIVRQTLPAEVPIPPHPSPPAAAPLPGAAAPSPTRHPLAQNGWARGPCRERELPSGIPPPSRAGRSEGRRPHTGTSRRLPLPLAPKQGPGREDGARVRLPPTFLSTPAQLDKIQTRVYAATKQHLWRNLAGRYGATAQILHNNETLDNQHVMKLRAAAAACPPHLVQLLSRVCIAASLVLGRPLPQLGLSLDPSRNPFSPGSCCLQFKKAKPICGTEKNLFPASGRASRSRLRAALQGMAFATGTTREDSVSKLTRSPGLGRCSRL